VERPGESPGALVARSLAERTGYETRLTVLGHVQRGGSPTATDRLLAATFGVTAMAAAHEGAFGTFAAVRDDETTLVPLALAASGPRSVPTQLLQFARKLTLI